MRVKVLGDTKLFSFLGKDGNQISYNQTTVYDTESGKTYHLRHKSGRYADGQMLDIDVYVPDFSAIRASSVSIVDSDI